MRTLQKKPDFTQEYSVIQPMPYVIVCILITEMRTILITETSQRPLPGYTLFTFRAINTIGGILTPNSSLIDRENAWEIATMNQMQVLKTAQTSYL